MVSLAVALAAAFLAVLPSLLLRSIYKRGPSHLIPGPESTSFLAGNILEISSTFTGVYNATLRWRRQFGDAPLLRIKGPLFSVCSPNYKVAVTNAVFIRVMVTSSVIRQLYGRYTMLMQDSFVLPP